MSNFFEMFGRFAWVAMWLVALFLGWGALQYIHTLNLNVLQAFLVKSSEGVVHSNGALVLIAAAWTAVCTACGVLAIAEDCK